jgi:hypothetical protein
VAETALPLSFSQWVCVFMVCLCWLNVSRPNAFWPKDVKLDFVVHVPSHLAVRHLAYTMFGHHSCTTGHYVNECLYWANVCWPNAFWPKDMKLDFAGHVPSHLAVRHLAYSIFSQYGSATGHLVYNCFYDVYVLGKCLLAKCFLTKRRETRFCCPGPDIIQPFMDTLSK